MPDPASGQRLDDGITLLRCIGRGGMADVWLARDRRHEQPIVVKLLAEDASAESVRLLERESLAVRRLDHPNIIEVLGFHAGPGRAYVAMEHVEGGDAGRLRRRPAQGILAAMLPIADALRHAHRRGVVHRDVKASNVLLDSGEHPFLVDFGIAAFGSVVDSVRGGGSVYHLEGVQEAPAAAQATDFIPRDRVIDGIDQTALLLEANTMTKGVQNQPAGRRAAWQTDTD